MADSLLMAALVVAALGAVLATSKLLRGPDLATRSVSLDVLTVMVLPLIVGVAVVAQRAIYLDLTLVYGVLAFLGVLSIARFYEKGV